MTFTCLVRYRQQRISVANKVAIQAELNALDSYSPWFWVPGL